MAILPNDIHSHKRDLPVILKNGYKTSNSTSQKQTNLNTNKNLNHAIVAN